MNLEYTPEQRAFRMEVREWMEANVPKGPLPSFDLTREGFSTTEKGMGPLTLHERRWWDSLLAPVYIQLLEGLIRVTEGQRGAAFCRECGQPFLTLDARRSSFCTDRERYRHGQRERRKRLAVGGSVTPTGSVTTKIKRRVREP